MTMMNTEPQQQQIQRVEATPANRIVVVDNSDFSNLLDTAKFEHLWRVAKLFSATALVPEHFRDQPENCFVAIQMAMRLGVDPLMILQNTYIVHGKPGMEAKMSIALINSSGLFADSLDYEVSGGPDPFATDYKVRAFATRKSTGKVCHGPWVDWKMVRAEGWESKSGSKWKTIPGLMFQYRAGTFFGRTQCPERLMGMQTVEEIRDTGEERTAIVDVPQRRIADLIGDDAIEAAKPEAPKNGNGHKATKAAKVEPPAPPSDPTPTATQEPTADTAQPTEEDLTDYPTYFSLAQKAALDSGMTDDQFRKRHRKHALLIGKADKEETTSVDWRAATLAALRAGKLDENGKIEA